MHGTTKLSISYASVQEAITNYLRDHVFGPDVVFTVTSVSQNAAGPYGAAGNFEVVVEHPAPTDSGTGT
jgi:hypothetical protein